MTASITRYLDFIEDLYQMAKNKKDKLGFDEKVLGKIDRKYRKYRLDHGAEIRDFLHIT